MIKKGLGQSLELGGEGGGAARLGEGHNFPRKGWLTSARKYTGPQVPQDGPGLCHPVWTPQTCWVPTQALTGSWRHQSTPDRIPAEPSVRGAPHSTRVWAQACILAPTCPLPPPGLPWLPVPAAGRQPTRAAHHTALAASSEIFSFHPQSPMNVL